MHLLVERQLLFTVIPLHYSVSTNPLLPASACRCEMLPGNPINGSIVRRFAGVVDQERHRNVQCSHALAGTCMDEEEKQISRARLPAPGVLEAVLGEAAAGGR